MVSAKDAQNHPDNTARSSYHHSSHPSQYTYSEPTMYPVSSKYSHRPQEPFPKKMPYDNMKQLLSKPAIIPSLAGPSESGAHSLRTAQREPTQLKRRIASEDTHSRSEGSSTSAGRGNRSASETEGTHHSNWVAPWELEHAGSSAEALTPPQRGGLFGRSPSMTRRYASDGGDVSSGKRKEEEKKFRTVLRKPSSNRPTSPTSLEYRPPILSSGLVSSPTSLLTPASRSVPHSQASTIHPTKGKARLDAPSPSPSQVSSRNSSRSRPSSRDKGSPGHMTPAEEVMLSYKSQMERERLIERSFEEAERKVAEARRLSDERRASVKVMREKELERGKEQIMVQGGSFATAQASSGRPPRALSPTEITPPSTPYYTVFGSTSGRVVAADDDNGFHEQDQFSENFRNLRPSAGGHSHKETQNQTVSVSIGATRPSKDSHGFGKALGRKLSFRWTGLRSNKHENHTPTSSMTGITSIDSEFGGHPISHEKRLSIAGRRATSPSSSKKSPYPGLRLSIEGSNATESRASSHRYGGDSVGIMAVSPKPHSAPSLGLTSTASSPLGGSSESKSGLRSLLRRLSTGALRDLQPRVAPDSCPPPVPALPQSVASMMRTGTKVKSAQTSASGSPVHRTRTQRSYSDNTGARRPQTSTGIPQSAPPKSSSSSTTTSNRPSTATSSSPEGYFTSHRSPRSSTSSYGKEIPPLPTFSNLKLETPRYILSPSELEASQQYVNGPVIPDMEKTLPIPPSQRRRKTSQTDFVSPVIPEFSTASPINVFPKKIHTGRPVTSSSAPPLPARSANRPVTSAFPISSPVSYTPSVLANSRHTKNDDVVPPNRKSTSSIKKPASVSPLEPTVGRTSDEEVWEGLLRKSAEAGGTLHIRSTDTEQLESDNLRFSVTEL